MYNFEKYESMELNEITYKTTLKNGLDVYICKRPGFVKKMGMFGTKYGSIINDFVDIKTNERIKVPDGIAHFLEHKLFEQEGANALDLFAKLGISSNAYTSFDQTVYYFETINKFNEAVELLIKLVKTPYFTDENVNKEQGIIGQEINMYADDPGFTVYFNALRAMYKNHPIRIDIAGTIESISKITKDMLYTCYNTFYNPSNMFFLVVGDVDVNETVKNIEDNIRLYEKDYDSSTYTKIEKFVDIEDTSINTKDIEQDMDIYMPQICIGYKLNVVKGEEIIKRQIITEVISEMYFSKLTDFFNNLYTNGIISNQISVDYEGSDNFSHVLISASAIDIKKLKQIILDYIEKIKSDPIDKNLFEIVKNKKIGENILASENINVSYRRIIESILDNTKLYSDIEILKSISENDIREFLYKLNSSSQVTSIINQK